MVFTYQPPVPSAPTTARTKAAISHPARRRRLSAISSTGSLIGAVGAGGAAMPAGTAAESPVPRRTGGACRSPQTTSRGPSAVTGGGSGIGGTTVGTEGRVGGGSARTSAGGGVGGFSGRGPDGLAL